MYGKGYDLAMSAYDGMKDAAASAGAVKMRLERIAYSSSAESPISPPVDSITEKRRIGEVLGRTLDAPPNEPTNEMTTTYNVYINDAKINDIPAVRTATKNYLMELHERGQV